MSWFYRFGELWGAVSSVIVAFAIIRWTWRLARKPEGDERKEPWPAFDETGAYRKRLAILIDEMLPYEATDAGARKRRERADYIVLAIESLVLEILRERERASAETSVPPTK